MRLAFLLLFTATPAFAGHEPVRDDISAIRHDRTPDRHVFLGWTGDNRAVSHIARCGISDIGIPFCSATLEVAHGMLPDRTEVLAPESTGGAHWTVPTQLARQAIRAERDALAELGQLQPSAHGPLPKVTLDASSCRIDVLVGTQRTERALAIDGERCSMGDGNEAFRDAHVLSVRMSPDRLHLAVTIEVLDTINAWTDPMTRTVIVNAS